MSERSDIEDVWGEIVGDAFTPSHPLPPPPEFAGAVDEEMQARPSARLPLHVVPMSGPDSDAMPIEVGHDHAPAGRVGDSHPSRSVAGARARKTSWRPQSEADALAAPQTEVADPVVEVDLRQRRRKMPTMRTAPVSVQDDLDVVLFEVAQTGPHAIVPPEEIVELDVTDLDIDEYPSLLEADGRAVIEVDLDDVTDDEDDQVVAGEIDIVEPRAVPRGPGEATRSLARSAAIANAMRGATVRVPLVPERKVKTAMPSVSRMHPAKANTARTAAVAVSPARPHTMRAAALATARPQTMRVAAIAVSPTQPAIVASPEVAESPKPTEVVASPEVAENPTPEASPTSNEVVPETPAIVPAAQPRTARPSTVRVVAVSGVKPATVRATAVPVDAREVAFAPAPVPVMPAPVALTPPPSDPPLVDRAPSSSVSLRRVSVGDHVVAPRRNGWAWIAGAAAVVLGAIAIAAWSGSDAEPAAAGASVNGVAAAAVQPAKPSLAQTPVATPETPTPVLSEPAAAPSEASPSEAAVVNAEPVEPVDEARRAAGRAYVAAVERFEADHSNEAVEAMVSAACEMDDGPRARSAFRKLRGADQRTRVMIACRNRGIDLWARVDGPTASELLVVAERHLAEGDYVHALQSARESNHVTRNNGALFVMGVAQCKLGRPAEAEELERHLPPRMRRDLDLACAGS